MFVDDHLRGVPGPATLEYAYSKRGSLEAPIDDVARVVVVPASTAGSRSVKVAAAEAAQADGDQALGLGAGGDGERLVGARSVGDGDVVGELGHGAAQALDQRLVGVVAREERVVDV